MQGQNLSAHEDDIYIKLASINRVANSNTTSEKKWSNSFYG